MSGLGLNQTPRLYSRRVTRSLSLSNRQPTPSLFAIWLQSVSSCGSLETLQPISRRSGSSRSLFQ